MYSFEVEAVRNFLKKEFWGYRVVHHTEYEDYTEPTVIERENSFLFIKWKEKVQAEKTIIKKEDIEWKEMRGEARNIFMLGRWYSIPYEIDFYIYVDYSNRVVLFR